MHKKFQAMTKSESLESFYFVIQLQTIFLGIVIRLVVIEDYN